MKAGNLKLLISEEQWENGKKNRFLKIIKKKEITFPKTNLCLQQNRLEKVSYRDLENALYADVVGGLTTSVVNKLSKKIENSTQLIDEGLTNKIKYSITNYWQTNADFLCDIYARSKYSTSLESFIDAITELYENKLTPSKITSNSPQISFEDTCKNTIDIDIILPYLKLKKKKNVVKPRSDQKILNTKIKTNSQLIEPIIDGKIEQQEIIKISSNSQKKEPEPIKLQKNIEIKQPKINKRKLLINNIKVDIKKKDDEQTAVTPDEPVKYTEFAKTSLTPNIVNSKVVDKIPSVKHKDYSDIEYKKLEPKGYKERLPKKLPDVHKETVDDKIVFSDSTHRFMISLMNHINKSEMQDTFDNYNKNKKINRKGKEERIKLRVRTGRENQVLSLRTAHNFKAKNNGLDYFKAYEIVYTDIDNEIHFGGKSRLQEIAHNGLDALTGVRQDNRWEPATIAADSNPYLNEFRVLRDLYDYKRFYEKSWKNRRGIPAERKQQYTDAIKLIELIIKDNKKFSTELPELIKIRDKIKPDENHDKLGKHIDGYIKKVQTENSEALEKIFDVNQFDSKPLLKLMAKYDIDITAENVDVSQLMNLFGPNFNNLKAKLINYFENIEKTLGYNQVGNPQYLFISKLIGIAEKVKTNEQLTQSLNETTKQLEKLSHQEKEKQSSEEIKNLVKDLCNQSDWQALIDRVLDVSDRVTTINMSENEKTAAIKSYFDLHDAIANTFGSNNFLKEQESNEKTFHTLINNDFFDMYFKKLIDLEENKELNKDNTITKIRKYFETIVLTKLETFTAYIKGYPTAIDSTFALSFERMMATKTIKELYKRQKENSPEVFLKHKNKQISILNSALLNFANKQTNADKFNPLPLMDLINGVPFINYEGEKLPLTKAIENDPLDARDIAQIKPHLRYAFIQFVLSDKYNALTKVNYIIEKLSVAKDWYEELGNSSVNNDKINEHKLIIYKDDNQYKSDLEKELNSLIKEYLLELLKSGDYQELDKVIEKGELFTLHGVKYADEKFIKTVLVGKQHKNLLDNLKEEENKGGSAFDKLKMSDEIARNLAYFLSREECEQLKKQLSISAEYETVTPYQKEVLNAFNKRIAFWEKKIYTNESKKTLQEIHEDIKESKNALNAIKNHRKSNEEKSLDFDDDLQGLSLLSAYSEYLANIEIVKKGLTYLNKLTASTVPDKETLNENTVSLKEAIKAINTLNLTNFEEKFFIDEISPLLAQAKLTLRSILINANEEQQKAYLNTYNALLESLPVTPLMEQDKKQAKFLVDSINNGKQKDLISKCDNLLKELTKNPEQSNKNKVQDHSKLCKELFDQLSPDNITLLHFCLSDNDIDKLFNKKVEGEPLLTALLSAIDESIKTKTPINFISIIANNIQKQPCSKTYAYLVMRFGSHEQVQTMHREFLDHLKNQANNDYNAKKDYLDAIEMVRKEAIDPYRHITTDKGIYDSCDQTDEQWNLLVDHLLDKQNYDLAAYILQGHGSDEQYLNLKNIRVLEHLKTVVNNKEKNSPEEKLLLLYDTSEKLFCDKSIKSIAETLSLAITTMLESLESDLFQSICELYNQALSSDKIAEEVKSQLLLNFKNNFLDIVKNPAAKDYFDTSKLETITRIIATHLEQKDVLACYEEYATHCALVIGNQFVNKNETLATIWAIFINDKLDTLLADKLGNSAISEQLMAAIANKFILEIETCATNSGLATGNQKAIELLQLLTENSKPYQGMWTFIMRYGSKNSKKFFNEYILKASSYLPNDLLKKFGIILPERAAYAEHLVCSYLKNGAEGSIDANAQENLVEKLKELDNKHPMLLTMQFNNKLLIAKGDINDIKRFQKEYQITCQQNLLTYPQHHQLIARYWNAFDRHVRKSKNIIYQQIINDEELDKEKKQSPYYKLSENIFSAKSVEDILKLLPALLEKTTNVTDTEFRQAILTLHIECENYIQDQKIVTQEFEETQFDTSDDRNAFIQFTIRERQLMDKLLSPLNKDHGLIKQQLDQLWLATDPLWLKNISIQSKSMEYWLGIKNQFIKLLDNSEAQEYIDLDRRRIIVGIITEHLGKEHAIECYEAIAEHYSFVIANQFSNKENKLADIWVKAKSASLDKLPAKSQLSQSYLTAIADNFITEIEIMANNSGSATGDPKAIHFLAELLDEKKSYAGLLDFVWKNGSAEVKELFRKSITKILDNAKDVEFIPFNTLTTITDIFAKHGEQACATACYEAIARHCSWVIDNQAGFPINKSTDKIWNDFKSKKLDIFLPENLKNSSYGEHYLKSIVEQFTSPLENIASQFDLSSNNETAIIFLQNLSDNKNLCEGMLDFIWKHGPETTKTSFKNSIKLPIKSSATDYIAPVKLKIITNIIAMIAKYHEIDYATECYKAIKLHCKDVISSHLKTKKLSLGQVWNNFKSSEIVTIVIDKLRENSSRKILEDLADKFIFEIEASIPQLNLTSDNQDAMYFLQQLGENKKPCEGMLDFVCKYGSEKSKKLLITSFINILSNKKSKEFISSEKINIISNIMTKYYGKTERAQEYYRNISNHCVSVINNQINSKKSLADVWEKFNSGESEKSQSNIFAKTFSKVRDIVLNKTLLKTLEDLPLFQQVYLENIANKFISEMQKMVSESNSDNKCAIEFLQKLGDNKEPYEGMLAFVWKYASKDSKTQFRQSITSIQLPEKQKVTSTSVKFFKSKEVSPQDILNKVKKSLEEIKPYDPLNTLDKEVENKNTVDDSSSKTGALPKNIEKN